MLRRLLPIVCAGFVLSAHALELGDYLPEGVPYDPAVPVPASVLGDEVGTWHVRHDQLVRYMEVLAEASPRVVLQETGRTHEGRRLLLMAVSSPENIRNLDRLRQVHLEEGRSGRVDPEAPLVVWQGHSVHGNEPSGANMSLLLAYHLAAGGGEVEALLEDTIVLIDPALNPDGVARFAQWANSHKSKNLVGDPQSREHQEVWPNGRTNHYWFDLNRDWLLLTHPESRARVREYHRWRPHVLTDFHEMGGNATYFFQPGVPERRHPMTPEGNHLLTAKIAEFHARSLDRRGRRYYAEETFDDFYYGKGSTYPDVQGTIGILFEQASSRGHLMQTDHGLLTFPTTIDNQFRTALSTLEAADALRGELKAWQAGFDGEARKLAARDTDRAYVFGDGGDPARARELIEILTRHRIEVRGLTRDIELEGRAFVAGQAWVVPLDQPQYRLAKAVFERRTDFVDETFYDVSSFNLALSFNLPFAAMGKSFNDALLGEAPATYDETRGRVRFPVAAQAAPLAADAVGWAFEWSGTFAPRALQRLHAEGIPAYVATEPLDVLTSDGRRRLGRGTILVSANLGRSGTRPGEVSPSAPERPQLSAALAILERIRRSDHVEVHALKSGATPTGVDLGSPSLRKLEPVRPLLVVGRGVRGYEAGELWHLLDTRVDLPLSMVEAPRIASLDLSDYTHLILVGGRYGSFRKAWEDKLRDWIQDGGVLVASQSGADWVTSVGLHAVSRSGSEESGSGEEREGSRPAGPPGRKIEPASDAEPEPEDASPYRPYAARRGDRAIHVIGGAIFQVELDTTHPLAFGYTEPLLPVHRNRSNTLKPSNNPYETVARYTDSPLISGYASQKRQTEIAGSAAVLVSRVGRGTVVRLTDNPAFRGVWYGTQKLFLNALFFGDVIDRTSASRAVDDHTGADHVH
ncbi:hypothetical protein ABI59_00510 [Acidobacteria bacterium Mor1]|nr:hypothetical protein ABI59_00510 [Acidobacteria bacterium Mor1]